MWVWDAVQRLERDRALARAFARHRRRARRRAAAQIRRTPCKVHAEFIMRPVSECDQYFDFDALELSYVSAATISLSRASLRPSCRVGLRRHTVCTRGRVRLRGAGRSARIAGAYGLRGVRVGEASHPGPPKRRVAADNAGRKARNAAAAAVEEWTITLPKTGNPCVCATCNHTILAGSVRMRQGAAGARVHHVGCAVGRSGDPSLAAGWDALPDKARAAAKTAYTTAAGAPASDSSTSDVAMHISSLPATDADGPLLPPDAPRAAANGGHEPPTLQLGWWDKVDWDDLHQPVSTGKAVPPQVHAAVAELRGAIARRQLEAMEIEEKVRAWKALLFLDRLLFAHKGAPKQQANAESLTKTLCRRIRSAWAGDWQSLWIESAESISVPGTLTARSDKQVLASDVREIQAALADEDERSAIRRVEGPMAMASTTDAVRELPALFPPARVPLPARTQPAAAAEQQDVLQFKELLDAAFRKAPRRRGPGPGGGRGEHWCFMPSHAAAWEPVRECFLNLALGRVPAVVQSAAAGARVLAGAKGAGKVRPFALGIVPRRLLARAVARMFASDVAAVVRPAQYGVGAKSGAEAMHKSVLCDLDRRGDACLDSFDVSNAHNEVERASLLDAVRLHVPRLLPWVEPWLYADALHVCHVPGAPPIELCKDRGGDQGDPLINLLFPLAFHKVVCAVRAAAAQHDEHARAYAYQDDLQIVTRPDGLAPAQAAFREACRSLGLRPNDAKEEVYIGPAADDMVDIAVRVVDRPRVLRHGGLDVQGLPAKVDKDNGSDTQLCANAPELDKLVSQRRGFLTRLAELHAAGLTSQHAMVLLRQRTSSDFVFLARACGIPTDTARTLDEETLALAVRIVGGDAGDWNEITRRRAFHPLRDGGLGLVSVALVAAAAHAASWHQVSPDIVSRLGLDSVAVLRAEVPWADRCLRDADAVVQECLLDRLAPAGSSHTRVSQRTLTEARVKKEVADVLAQLDGDPVASARMLSAAGPGAGAWLLTPTAPAHHFRNEQFAVAVRLRLGLPVPIGAGTCQHVKGNGTVCGAPLDQHGVHALTCPSGGWFGRRHDHVCKSLAAYCADNGCEAEREVLMPLAAPAHPEARMDVVIRSRGRPATVPVDATIVSPLTGEMLRRGASARVPGAAAQAAAKHKRAKYSNVDLVPFALETYGRWSEEARSFAKQVAPTGHDGRSKAITGLYRDVGTTLQRDNADAILAAAVRARAGIAPTAATAAEATAMVVDGGAAHDMDDDL